MDIQQMQQFRSLYALSLYAVRPPATPYQVVYRIDQRRIPPGNLRPELTGIPLEPEEEIIGESRQEIDQWIFRRRLWVDSIMNRGEVPLQFHFDEFQPEGVPPPPPNPPKLVRS